MSTGEDARAAAASTGEDAKPLTVTVGDEPQRAPEDTPLAGSGAVRPLGRVGRIARIVHARLADVADVLAPIDAAARSRTAFLFRVAAHVAAAILAIAIAVTTVRPLTAPRPPPPLPGEGTDGTRFGLSLERRRAIFTQLAATEAYSRRMGSQGFPTEPWSAEDHRCAYERDAVRGTAARNSLDLSTTYLILDEGIRSQWPGPDGKPLIATTVPLVPRRW